MNGTVPASMRAWVASAYGGPEVLALVHAPVPEPRPHEVLIRVQATTVSTADRRIRAMDFPAGLRLAGRIAFGVSRPRRRILGVEVTGIVVAAGSKAQRFAVGDAVIALCGVRMGGHAEYVALSERSAIVRRPAAMPVESAAALGFGGTAARDFLRRAGLRAHERVLVIGGSGTVGSALIQLAAVAGAHVTAITSTANLEMVRSLGAAKVIDYTPDEVSRTDAEYDIVADAVGAWSFSSALAVLADGGRYVAINGTLADMLARARNGRRCISGPSAERAEDLAALTDLWAEGRFSPLIDGVHPFEALPDAHARVDTGHKRGSAVVCLWG